MYSWSILHTGALSSAINKGNLIPFMHTSLAGYRSQISELPFIDTHPLTLTTFIEIIHQDTFT